MACWNRRCVVLPALHCALDVQCRELFILEDGVAMVVSLHLDDVLTILSSDHLWLPDESDRFVFTACVVAQLLRTHASPASSSLVQATAQVLFQESCRPEYVELNSLHLGTTIAFKSKEAPLSTAGPCLRSCRFGFMV